MDSLEKSYQLLGLEPGASPEQVRQAYRDLVKVWHPDRFSHDARLRQIAQEKLKEINGAYELLKANFFEAGISASASANSEAGSPAAEPAETIPRGAGIRSVGWLVLICLICVSIGGAVFFFWKKGTGNATATSPSSHALAFDGNHGHVDFATTGSLTGTFTVECWALTRRREAVEVLVNSRGPQEYGFDMKFAGDRIHGDIGDGSRWLTTTADAPFNHLPDTWYHVAYVVTPGHYLIYLNGELSVSKDDLPGQPVLYDAGHPLRIAMLNPQGEPLDGLISEMRIWQTARSAEQIQTNRYRSLTGTEAGLQGYWRFKEGAGTTVTDRSGHGFTGTLADHVMWVTNAPPLLFP